MIRGKLIAAREERGLTQEQLAVSVGVDAGTIRRWEHGESRPQGRNRRKLCRELGINEYDLDLIGVVDTAPPPPPFVIPACETLEHKLLTYVFQWPRGKFKYRELQGHIRTLTEGPMNKERRRAVELLGTLPISIFSLSPVKAPLVLVAEEVLPWLASGLIGAWRLGHGSELATADLIAASYLPALITLTNEATHRKQASALAAQGFMLRETMAWHLSSNKDAIGYAQQAEKYSTISEDVVLRADAMRRSALTYYYGKYYEEALQKAEKLVHLIEHAEVASSLKCQIYFDVATYQARCNQLEASKRSRRLATRFHSANNEVPAPYMGSVGSEVALLGLEGRTLASANMHADALSLYGQAREATTGTPVGERVRIGLLNDQLLSLLKQRSRDKEQCKKLWLDSVSSAQALESEQRFAEACHILDIMEAVWPGEDDIAELREIATHW